MGREKGLIGLIGFKQLQNCLIDFCNGLRHGGERGRNKSPRLIVVKADDCNIFRNPDVVFLSEPEKSESGTVQVKKHGICAGAENIGPDM